ncbi:hypothetical protein [Nonomuraea glycinis]|uniref:hypothetical protein n=1 Tax=Nonomuraea glycinis TaxID=2047744 RepID=UPI0033ACA2EA
MLAREDPTGPNKIKAQVPNPSVYLGFRYEGDGNRTRAVSYGLRPFDADEVDLALPVQDHVRGKAALSERVRKHVRPGIREVVRISTPRSGLQQREQIRERMQCVIG